MRDRLYLLLSQRAQGEEEREGGLTSSRIQESVREAPPGMSSMRSRDEARPRREREGTGGVKKEHGMGTGWVEDLETQHKVQTDL